MRISIIYRRVPDFEQHADRLAAEIREARGIEPEMIHGSGNVFDVRLNGDLIYSMEHTGKLPEVDDILGYMSSC